MPDARAPGSLAYMPLRFDRTLVCVHCGGAFATSSGNAKWCEPCRRTPAYRAWRNRQRNKWDRRYGAHD